MENILKFYYRNLIFYVLCYVHFYITYCIEVFMRERKMFNLKPTKSFKRICVSSLYSLPKNPTWLPKTYLQPHNARLWFPLLFLLKPYIEFPWNQNFLEWIPAHIKPQVKPQSGRRSVLRNRFHFWKYIKVWTATLYAHILHGARIFNSWTWIAGTWLKSLYLIWMPALSFGFKIKRHERIA